MMGGGTERLCGSRLSLCNESVCERERERLTTHHLCSCLGQEQQRQSLQLEEHLKNRGRKALTNSLSVHKYTHTHFYFLT